LSEHDHRAGPRLAAGQPRTLASDADRDAAAGMLGAAFAEGRLTADEHGERLSAAYRARTWQELRQLTADLPAAPGAGARRGTRPAVAGEPDRCLLCLLLCMCPPAGIAWWLLSRRRPAAGPSGRLTAVTDPAAASELPLPGQPREYARAEDH